MILVIDFKGQRIRIEAVETVFQRRRGRMGGSDDRREIKGTLFSEKEYSYPAYCMFWGICGAAALCRAYAP